MWCSDCINAHAKGEAGFVYETSLNVAKRVLSLPNFLPECVARMTQVQMHPAPLPLPLPGCCDAEVCEPSLLYIPGKINCLLLRHRSKHW